MVKAYHPHHSLTKSTIYHTKRAWNISSREQNTNGITTGCFPIRHSLLLLLIQISLSLESEMILTRVK